MGGSHPARHSRGPSHPSHPGIKVFSLQGRADRSTQGWQQTAGFGAKGREVSLHPQAPWPTASLNPQRTGDPRGLITSSTVDVLGAWGGGGREPLLHCPLSKPWCCGPRSEPATPCSKALWRVPAGARGRRHANRAFPTRTPLPVQRAEEVVGWVGGHQEAPRTPGLS